MTTTASTPVTGKRWYVVHAYSGFEKRVAAALKERVQRFGYFVRMRDIGAADG